MGRREAWSAEKSSDSRTKPTHWEFRRRDHHREDVDQRDGYNDQTKRVRSADEKRSIKVRYDASSTSDHGKFVIILVLFSSFLFQK